MSASPLPAALRTLADAATPARRRLFLATILLMLVGSVAELATIGAVLPFLAIVSDPSRVQDHAILIWMADLAGGRDGMLLALAGILVVVAVVAGLVRLALTWVNLKFVLLYGHDVGQQIFGRLIRQPYSHFVTRNSSDAIAAIEKLSTVIFGVLLPVMQGAAAALISVFIIVCLFLIDPISASAAGLSLGLTYLLVTLATRKILRRNSILLAKAASGRIRVLQEGLGGIRDILIDNSQPVFEKTFAVLDYKYRRAQVANNMVALSPRYLVETSVVILIAALTVYFVHRPGGLIAAIPVLGALAIGAQRLLPLVHLAYNGWTSFAGNEQLIIDVAGLLRMPVVQTTRDASAPSVQPFSRDIVMDSITFRYLEGEEALRDVDFVITKGERIGFVGRTGSGKSTLIDLLMGLLPPTEGTIRVDGVRLDETNMTHWQAQIAHVPQSIYLSDGPITSNIAFGVPEGEIDIARVQAAARRADIDDFILAQPQGYATTVGERGMRLSGGQRQRIGIARALYKGASVLVLDEATSALDEQTEAGIMDSIYRLGDDITLLLIAHRVSTLSGCDRIVRLENGQIVAIEDGRRVVS
jgi:ABC-type multidrug transport system fused ATPase/permease subunit